MIARIHARRRIRRIAPPREARLDRMLDRTRYGRRLRSRLAAGDLPQTPSGFVRLSAGCGLAGAAFAMLWANTPAGGIGLLVGAAAPELVLRRRVARRSSRIAAQLPEVLAALGAPIHAGASLPQAFAAAAAEAEPPMRDVLDRTCRDFDGGIPQDEAIGRFAQRCGIPEAMLAARALRVGRHAGGELASVVDEVAETLRDRDRLARQLRASTAQARMSATVVAALPVVFLILMSAGAQDQASLLFGEPIGWVLLAVGGSLEAAGVFWIRRITRLKGFA